MVKVRGQAQAFAEIKYVKNIVIIENGKKKIIESNFCIGRLQQIMLNTKSNAKLWADNKHELNIMLMNQKHIIDKFEKIGNPLEFDKFVRTLREKVPAKFFTDEIIELKYFPAKLMLVNNPNITGLSAYYKPTAVFIETIKIHADLLIAYLKQVKKDVNVRVNWEKREPYSKQIIAGFFEDAIKYKDNQDFNEYIDGWAKRLMKETALFPINWQWRNKDEKNKDKP